MNWNTKVAKTWEGKIFMAGDIDTAKQLIREEAYRSGMCVTISPTTYIYTGGEEDGFVVGLIQYPRFEAEMVTLESSLSVLAQKLAEKCCQKSFTITTPKITTYYQSKRHNK